MSLVTPELVAQSKAFFTRSKKLRYATYTEPDYVKLSQGSSSDFFTQVKSFKALKVTQSELYQQYFQQRKQLERQLSQLERKFKGEKKALQAKIRSSGEKILSQEQELVKTYIQHIKESLSQGKSCIISPDLKECFDPQEYQFDTTTISILSQDEKPKEKGWIRHSTKVYIVSWPHLDYIPGHIPHMSSKTRFETIYYKLDTPLKCFPDFETLLPKLPKIIRERSWGYQDAPVVIRPEEIQAVLPTEWEFITISKI